MVIYADIVVNFLRIWSTKSTITQNRKFDFSFPSTHCASFIKIGPFLRLDGGGEGLVSAYLSLGIARLYLNKLVLLRLFEVDPLINS